MGDLLFIHDAGAHGHAMGYNYNGKLRSAEVLLRCDGSYELIRRAETPADYFATLGFKNAPLSSVRQDGELLPMEPALKVLDAQAQEAFNASTASRWCPGVRDR